MHFCCNVVCGPEGRPSAVLLRAGEIVDGLDRARGRRPGAPDRDLARGPARLCRALDIGRDQNRTRLDAGELTLSLGESVDPGLVSTGPRVGLRLAAERPWRFWLTGEPTVSRYVAAKPRPTAGRVRYPSDTRDH